MLDFVGNLQFATDEYYGAGAAAVVLCNILQQANQGGFMQIRMKVQQGIGARNGRGAQMLETVHGLGDGALGRTDVDVEALEAVGYRPLKQR